MREQYDIQTMRCVCVFSPTYNLSPELFSAWMGILKSVPDSLIVLIRYSVAMETNLREEAINARVSEFPRKEHLARCCVADVTLDTQVCSDIVTVCVAPWHGVPMITIAGDRTCNRIGAYKELAVLLEKDEERFMNTICQLDDMICLNVNYGWIVLKVHEKCIKQHRDRKT